MFQKSKGVLISFIALAAILPIMLVGFMSGERLQFQSKADTNEVLRMWLEPSSLTVKVGQKVNLKIIASYDESNKIIPGLDFLVKFDPSLDIDTRSFSFTEGFNGRKTVGNIEVTALKSGKAKVWIDEASVGTGLPNLSVVSTGTEITIRD